MTSRNQEGRRKGRIEGGKRREGREGRREGREKRKKGRKKEKEKIFLKNKPSRKITLPKSDEISLVSVPVVNARNLAVEEYLLIS